MPSSRYAFSNSLRLLQQEHGIVLAREYKDRFYARQHKAQPIRDAASERFRRIEAIQQEIVDIYNEALQTDALVGEANSDAPLLPGPSCGRREVRSAPLTPR